MGLLRVTSAGNRRQARVLEMVRGFKTGSQSNDAHKELLRSSVVKPQSINFFSSNVGGTPNVFIRPTPQPRTENGFLQRLRQAIAPTRAPAAPGSLPTYPDPTITQWRATPQRIRSGQKPGIALSTGLVLSPFGDVKMNKKQQTSLTKRIGDIWALHHKWAEQRAPVWDATLAEYDRTLVTAVIKQLVKSGSECPTLPQLVSLCEEKKRRGWPVVDANRSEPKAVRYIQRRPGKRADFQALGAWKVALDSLRKEGHGMDVDLWLENMELEISEHTLWLDISQQMSTDARYVAENLLTRGEVIYDNDDVPDDLRDMAVGFNLERLQQLMNGLAIGIKTRDN